MNGTMQSMERAHKRKKIITSIIIVVLVAGVIAAGFYLVKMRPAHQAAQTFEDLMNQPVPEITAEQRAQYDAVQNQAAPTATTEATESFNALMLQGNN